VSVASVSTTGLSRGSPPNEAAKATSRTLRERVKESSSSSEHRGNGKQRQPTRIRPAAPPADPLQEAHSLEKTLTTDRINPIRLATIPRGGMFLAGLLVLLFIIGSAGVVLEASASPPTLASPSGTQSGQPKTTMPDYWLTPTTTSNSQNRVDLRPTAAPAAVESAPPPVPVPVISIPLTPSTLPTTNSSPTASTSMPLVGNAQAASKREGATRDQPFGARTKDRGCLVQDALPDRACTPGAVLPDVTAEQVCQAGYGATVRNVPASLSREVYHEYGIVEPTSGPDEVDHLVPIELGASNDIANLWPEVAEPRPGLHEKDQLEKYLHDQVCTGATSLLEAQRAIATNWLEVYQWLLQRAPGLLRRCLAPTQQHGISLVTQRLRIRVESEIDVGEVPRKRVAG